MPMRRGSVYLTMVLDWSSRRVLASRRLISIAADASVEALEETIKHGVPEIMNTDQGSQFTPVARTPVSTDRYPMPCTPTSRHCDGWLNPQGDHLRSPKNCPTGWHHFCHHTVTPKVCRRTYTRDVRD